ncbi:MAG: hypothetical protein QOI95_4202 [Acidimicrobiaceae bacterium]|jgi:hypothetical protein
MGKRHSRSETTDGEDTPVIDVVDLLGDLSGDDPDAYGPDAMSPSVPTAGAGQ